MSHSYFKNLGHLKFYQEFPEHRSVLTHGKDAVIQMPDHKKEALVAVELIDNRFVIISTQEEQGSSHWFYLVQQGIRQQLQFEGYYTTDGLSLKAFTSNIKDSRAQRIKEQNKQSNELVQSIVNSSEPIEWFRAIIKMCIELHASDVHFEIRHGKAFLRVRRDGLMRDVQTFDEASLRMGAIVSFNPLTRHDATQYASHGNACLFCVVMGLQIDPALRIGAKEHAQAQGRVHGDAAQPFHNFIDAPGWHVNGFGKRVLADPHGFEPVFQQDHAGVYQGNFAGHNFAPSVVINNLNAVGVTAFQPHKTHTPLVINAYAVLATAVAFQCFQHIARRQAQEIQRCRGIQLL